MSGFSAYAHLITKGKVGSNGCHVCGGANEYDKHGRRIQSTCEDYGLADGQVHCHLVSGETINSGSVSEKNLARGAVFGVFSLLCDMSEQAFRDNLVRSLNYINFTADKRGLIIVPSENDISGTYENSLGRSVQVASGTTRKMFLGVPTDNKAGLYSINADNKHYMMVALKHDYVLIFDDNGDIACSGSYGNACITLYCGSDFAGNFSRQTPMSKVNIVKMKWTRIERPSQSVTKSVTKHRR
jgi:hypothetical protein